MAWWSGVLLSLLVLAVVCTADGPELRTVESVQAAVASDKPHIILFTSSRPSCVACTRLAPLWTSFVALNRASLTGASAYTVDCSHLTNLCAQYGVLRYPRIEYYSQGQDERFIYYGSRQPEKIRELVVKHGESPDSLQIFQGISRLTQNTFERHLAHGTHFVLFHAHWCSHCRQMMPAWEQLGSALDSDPTVDIAMVECEEDRRVCQSYAVKGYPTILLIVDGAVKSQYDGQRDVSSLISFIHTSTGRSDMPGTFSVSSSEMHRLSRASVQRFEKYGTAVVRPLPAAVPATTTTTPSAVSAKDATVAVNRFAARLNDWLQRQKDSTGKVDVVKVAQKIKALLAAEEAQLAAGSHSSTTSPSSVGGSGVKKDQLADQLQRMLLEHGINAEVETIRLDTPRAAAAGGRKAASTDSKSSQSGSSSSSSSGQRSAGGASTPGVDRSVLGSASQQPASEEDEEDLSDEGIARLQQQLERKLNDKLKQHLANGDISNQQVADVKRFVGKLQDVAEAARQGAANTDGLDPQDLQVDVELEDNAFLSADDIREIREAVATGLGQGAGGHLGQGNLGPGGFDLDAEDNAQAEADGVQMARVKSDAFRVAEVKLRERLMQRMRERGNAHSSEELGSKSPHDDQQLEEEEGAEMNAQSERLHNTMEGQPRAHTAHSGDTTSEFDSSARDNLGRKTTPSAASQLRAEATSQQQQQQEESAQVQEKMVEGRAYTQLAVDLTPKTFEVVAANGPVFVYFYAPWCKHCQTFEPVWDALAEKLHTTPGITIARLNCHAHKEFCRQREIPSYPELVLFKPPDQQIHYSGVRDVNSFYRYVMNHVPGVAAAAAAQSSQDTLAAGEPGTGSETDLSSPSLAVSRLWHVSSDEYQDALSQPLSFILFTSTICHHTLCRTSRADMERLANEIEDPDVSLAQVDCSRSGQLCDSEKLGKSPSGWFALYRAGDLIDTVHIKSTFYKLEHLRPYLDDHRSQMNSENTAGSPEQEPSPGL